MGIERTIEERVEDISMRYGHDWDRGGEAYIEGEFRLAVTAKVVSMSGDLVALALAAVEIRTALLSPTLDAERLLRAKAALGEALVRLGLVELLKLHEEQQS